MRQVHHQLHGVGLGQGPTVKPDPLAGRQFHFNAAPLQFTPIIPGMGFLTSFDEPVPIPVPPHIRGVHRAHSGHQQDIAIVTDPGPLQVGVTESVDHIVRDVESPATVPPREAGVWAHLHHPKGHRRPGIGVAMPTGSNEGVHCLTQWPVHPSARSEQNGGQQHSRKTGFGRKAETHVSVGSSKGKEGAPPEGPRVHPASCTPGISSDRESQNAGWTEWAG